MIAFIVPCKHVSVIDTLHIDTFLFLLDTLCSLYHMNSSTSLMLQQSIPEVYSIYINNLHRNKKYIINHLPLT
jgi:hypothetical protein